MKQLDIEEVLQDIHKQPYIIPGLPGYFGGKESEGVYQRIINHIPPHKHYIELFLGRGTIMRYKKPAKINVGIEIDYEVCEKWKKAAIPGITIYHESAISAFSCDIHDLTEETFIYADPPYPHETRGKTRYKFEMTNDRHIELLKELIKVSTYKKCKIAISTYDNPLYRELLRGWNIIHFNSTTRGGIRVETLYMNYDPPTELHDYRYLGENKTDRQRIKRKIKRHIECLEQLPVLERNAIIQAIKNK